MVEGDGLVAIGCICTEFTLDDLIQFEEFGRITIQREAIKGHLSFFHVRKIPLKRVTSHFVRGIHEYL